MRNFKKFMVYSLVCLGLAALLYAATGDETATLTSSVERRVVEPRSKPVWEHVITATHDVDDTGDVTQAIYTNGILLKVILNVPDYTTGSAVTGQVQINDNGDNEIFDSGEQAENTTYTFNVYEPLSGTTDVVIGLSAAGGGTHDTVVTLRGI